MGNMLAISLCFLSLAGCGQDENSIVDDKAFITVEELIAYKTKYDRQHVRLKARATSGVDFCFIRPLAGHIRNQPFFWYWGSDGDGDCQTNPNGKYGIAIVEGIYLADTVGRTYSEYGVINNAKVAWLEELTADEYYAQ